MSEGKWDNDNIRHLDITDLERIERYKHAGYGGSVSDSLNSLGIRNTVFSSRFKPLRQGMQLVGRALPIKAHSIVEQRGAPAKAYDAHCRPFRTRIYPVF